MQPHVPSDDARELVSSRWLDVPRVRVYRAFSDPDELARWWGPAGFTNTFHEFDLRPGGAWRFVMHAPDGTEYAMAKTFVEVVPPERIVLDHAQPGHDFRMTMTLAEERGGTRVTWAMRFAAAEQLEPIRDVVAQANEQNLDRLAARLAGSPA